MQSDVDINTKNISSLITNLADETLARQSKDTDLQSQITTNSTNISNEITNRKKADDELQADINQRAYSADVDSQFIEQDAKITTNAEAISDLESIVEEHTTKLDTIETGAQVNKINSISLNGNPLTPDTNKNVEITIPKISVDNKTINNNSKDEIQAIGLMDTSDSTFLSSKLARKVFKIRIHNEVV